MPEKPMAKNIDVSIVAYADAFSPTSIRAPSGSIMPLEDDLVLLKSTRSLGQSIMTLQIIHRKPTSCHTMKSFGQTAT